MKALNRAIGRTVSQLARYGAEGCHPPMLMALENHLDALLTMERKQLEVAGMKFATLTSDGTGEAMTGLAKHLRTEPRPFSSPLIVADRFATKMPVQELAQKTECQPTPAEQEPRSLPPIEWREGDTLVCVTEMLTGFKKGRYYRISRIGNHNDCIVQDDDGKECDIGGTCAKFFRNFACRPAGQDGQPAPDVIDMTDPANWQEGDIVLRTGKDWVGFFHGSEYRVAKVKAEKQEIYIARDNDAAWTSYTFGALRDDGLFKWLRHGDTA